MVTQASIISHIYKGYGKTARVLGATFQHYRPSGPDNPLAIGNQVGPMMASFNAMDMRYAKPSGYGKPTWFGIFDGTGVQVGDYLVGPSTYFVAAMQPLLPILVVECNRTVSVKRPQQTVANGVQGYSGNTEAGETDIMTAWPCALLQGTKGEKSEVALPGDTRTAWWVLLLPYAGVPINPFDALEDDLGRRYVLSSVELSDLGWRCTAMEAVS